MPPRRILFVDDEPDIIAAFTLSLQMMGWETEGHSQPASALERFKADPRAFAFVITDFTLPQMACADFVSRLRAIRPEIPIHLCTGNAEHEIQEAASAMGVRHVLYKPFDFDGLERFIGSLPEAEEKPWAAAAGRPSWPSSSPSSGGRRTIRSGRIPPDPS
jgi:DNA-binding NtrC family response regulator